MVGVVARRSKTFLLGEKCLKKFSIVAASVKLSLGLRLLLTQWSLLNATKAQCAICQKKVHHTKNPHFNFQVRVDIT